MTSAPLLPGASKRLSAVEACRVLASQIWRRERFLPGLKAGGLNSERAVRQRLHAVAGELQKVPALDDNVALHLYSIDWLEADPLSILERTEGLIDRQCRSTYPSVDALLRERDRATELAVRLLVLQGLAGRLGRWAVRAGEIPDARTARAHYRELGAPEWSQYCKLTDEGSAAFERGEHSIAAAKLFDADRLVRTPAGLLMAAVALSRIREYVGALWTIRVGLLEPEETFESPGAYQRAVALEAGLRELVEARPAEPVDLEDDDVEPVGAVDIVEEQKDVLETEGATLRGTAPPPAEKAPDSWNERYVAVERIPTRPSSPEHLRLIENEQEHTQLEAPRPPPRAPTAATQRIVRKMMPANQPEDPSTDVLAAMTLPMGPHTRETALAALDREEEAHSVDPEETAELQPRPPAEKIVLKRTHEITQVVRNRARPAEPELERPTDLLVSRSPFDRDC